MRTYRSCRLTKRRGWRRSAIRPGGRSSNASRTSRCSVGELAGELPVSRPAVSQHLKVLKEAGLVLDRPAGTRRIYQLDPDGLGALRAYLDHFWDQALAGYKRAVEGQTKESS